MQIKVFTPVLTQQTGKTPLGVCLDCEPSVKWKRQVVQVAKRYRERIEKCEGECELADKLVKIDIGQG